MPMYASYGPPPSRAYLADIFKNNGVGWSHTDIVFETADYEIVCFTCIRDNMDKVGENDENTPDEWKVIAKTAWVEGPDIECPHCGEMIESEEGDLQNHGVPEYE